MIHCQVNSFTRVKYSIEIRKARWNIDLSLLGIHHFMYHINTYRAHFLLFPLDLLAVIFTKSLEDTLYNIVDHRVVYNGGAKPVPRSL